MRWDILFADLEARFDDLADAELMAQLPDRQRSAAGRLTMVQRCAGSLGASVRVRLRSGRLWTGELRTVGSDWLLLDGSGGQDIMIALAAVTSLEGLTPTTGLPLTDVARRFDLRMALRGIARDRSPVVVAVTGSMEGHHGGGTELPGTIDRVGADFIEVAQHAMWEPRRAQSVRAVLLVPLAAIDTVVAVPQA